MLSSMSSLWGLVLIVVVLPTLVAMSGPVFIRRWVGLDKLSNNNEVAGFKFATVGVTYAVLLAFAVIVVWEKFSATEDDVARAAGAAAAVYRLIDGIEGDTGPKLHAALSTYLESAIARDWPAMEHGKAGESVTRDLNNVYATALAYRPTDPRGAVLLGEILKQLDAVTEARRSLLVKSQGAVPQILWIVLCCGAAITVGFTFFFGAENLRAQSAMTGGLAVLICSGLLVIVAIDRPFTGALKVGPEPLVEVLRDLGPHRAAR